MRNDIYTATYFTADLGEAERSLAGSGDDVSVRLRPRRSVLAFSARMEEEAFWSL